MCPIHGKFYQTPNAHLQGHGCLKCGYEKTIEFHTYTRDQFIEKAKDVHGNRYSYDFVNYISSKENVTILCPFHGKFFQTPNNHLRGHGCPTCGNEKRSESHTYTRDQFIENAKNVHGNRYLYDFVNYSSSAEKVVILCPTHGEFLQTPSNHVNNRQGCPKCSIERLAKSQAHTLAQFIQKAQNVHGHKYDYSLVEYKNGSTKIQIICKNHGLFLQQAQAHLQGMGCPKCKHPKKQQNELAEFIQGLRPNIQIDQDRRGIFSSRPLLEVDIYIPALRLGFEWNGFPYHYETLRNPGYRTRVFRNRHSDKALLARTHNIRLIQIFADQWQNPRIRPILESLIRLSLNKPQHIIHARKCKIKELSNKQVRNFLLDHHLYGPVLATVNLGLFHQDCLVSMMSFLNKSRFSKEQNTWELIRYCPILNTSISGGPQKLFKFFLKNYKPNRIECFQDLSIFNTNKIWENLGFELEKITPPAFWPIDQNLTRHHRSQFTKPKMMKKYDNIDPNLTQIENILNIPEFAFHGVVWDAGHLKYVWRHDK